MDSLSLARQYGSLVVFRFPKQRSGIMDDSAIKCFGLHWTYKSGRSILPLEFNVADAGCEGIAPLKIRMVSSNATVRVLKRDGVSVEG